MKHDKDETGCDSDSDKLRLKAARDYLVSLRPSPLPYDIEVTIDGDNILVANPELGFCITLQSIKSEFHKEQYPPTLDRLIEEIPRGRFAKQVEILLSARDEIAREEGENA